MTPVSFVASNIGWIACTEEMPPPGRLCYGWSEGKPVQIVKVSGMRLRAGCEPQHCWSIASHLPGGDPEGTPTMITHWCHLLIPEAPSLLPPG